MQLDTLKESVYIKLSGIHHVEELLLTTSGKQFLHRRDGTQTEVTIISAETHTVTVRVFNIPLEIHSDRITDTLVKYGKIHDIRNEKWSNAYNFAIYSGIHAIKMEVKVPIPSKLYLAGYKALITCDGQIQSYYYCNETTNFRYNCPALLEFMSVSGNEAPRTFIELIRQHLTHELRDPDEVSNNRGPELHATDEPTPIISVTHRPQENTGKRRTVVGQTS
jgi:hypothetical protein